MRRLIGLLICLLTVPTSAAVAETMLEVASKCRAFATVEILADGSIRLPSDADTQFCWGAFAGIQTAIFLVDDNRFPVSHVCAPQKAGRTQLIKIFLKYANQHPELGHLAFGGTAINSLIEAFPCREK
jgi:Rap1a immunity proteins